MKQRTENHWTFYDWTDGLWTNKLKNFQLWTSSNRSRLIFWCFESTVGNWSQLDTFRTHEECVIFCHQNLWTIQSIWRKTESTDSFHRMWTMLSYFEIVNEIESKRQCCLSIIQNIFRIFFSWISVCIQKFFFIQWYISFIHFRWQNWFDTSFWSEKLPSNMKENKMVKKKSIKGT